jgi:hypothetical protein
MLRPACWCAILVAGGVLGAAAGWCMMPLLGDVVLLAGLLAFTGFWIGFIASYLRARSVDESLAWRPATSDMTVIKLRCVAPPQSPPATTSHGPIRREM